MLTVYISSLGKSVLCHPASWSGSDTQADTTTLAIVQSSMKICYLIIIRIKKKVDELFSE